MIMGYARPTTFPGPSECALKVQSNMYKGELEYCNNTFPALDLGKSPSIPQSLRLKSSVCVYKENGQIPHTPNQRPNTQQTQNPQNGQPSYSFLASASISRTQLQEKYRYPRLPCSPFSSSKVHPATSKQPALIMHDSTHPTSVRRATVMPVIVLAVPTVIVVPVVLRVLVHRL